MSEATPAPARPTHVAWKNEDQDLVVGMARACRSRILKRMVEAELPEERRDLRRLAERIGALLDTLTTPRCTIVTPPARRPAEGEGSDAG